MDSRAIKKYHTNGQGLISLISTFIFITFFAFSACGFTYNKKLNDNANTKKTEGSNANDWINTINLRGSPDFKWCAIENWDKIYVSDTRYPKNRVEIKDKRILRGGTYFWGIFSYIKMAPEAPNGIHSEVENYSYEFIKGNKSYKIEVNGVNSFEFDKSQYNVDVNIYYLGKAFLPFPKYIRTDSTLNKIYESGCLIGNYQFTYPTFDSFRIRGFSNYIQLGLDSGEVKELKAKPNVTNKVLEVLDFYYYGQKVVMEIYNSDICLKDGKKIVWYKIKSGENLLTILSAG